MIEKIKPILKDNYRNIFGKDIASPFSDVFFTKCAIEINKIFLHKKENKTSVPHYKLADNKAGLYNKHLHKDSCFVIAGGSSLKDFDFSVLKDKTTFVSNKTIFDVPNANYFITTDYTFLNYLKKNSLYDEWKQHSADKFFVANCISDVIQNVNGQITDVRYNLNYELQDVDNIIICKSAKSVGFDFEHFNSGYNSGFSSFQLALIMGYKKIYLLGMDLNFKDEDTHYHGGYGKSSSRMNQNLIGYANHFIDVVKKLNKERPDIEVISCSPISVLNDFIPYKDIKEIL